MELTFTKMHGLGNDFIVIDCRSRELPDPRSFAMTFCDRRRGIGADQVLLLYPSTTVDFGMKIFNADGSEVEMCGNGIRCLANYIWARGLSAKDPLVIETPAGLISPRRQGGLVKVDMGAPILTAAHIPLALSQTEPVIDYPLRIEDREFKVTCVSMGNPHAVIFPNEDLSRFPVSHYGPLIEHHPLFPRRTNVEFVMVDGPGHVTMRVWERGAGETMACGTGASAVGVASMLKELTERTITVTLPGGDLVIEWAGDNHVYMTGPAVEVYEGKVRI
jgi:diaminopimelate epimerase